MKYISDATIKAMMNVGRLDLAIVLLTKEVGYNCNRAEVLYPANKAVSMAKSLYAYIAYVQCAALSQAANIRIWERVKEVKKSVKKIIEEEL